MILRLSGLGLGLVETRLRMSIAKRLRDAKKKNC